MDFLRIRKKAKKRAAARARPPPPDTVVTDADVLEGKLMAELQGPPAGEGEFLIAARGARTTAARDEAADLRGHLPPDGSPERAPEPEARPSPPGALDEFFFREDEPGSPVLDQGLAAAEHLEAPATPEARGEYLGFFLGEEEYALEIASVREILRAPVITEVPRGPRDVLGVVTVRGEVMPVIDPRRRLALPARPAGPGQRVVICQHGGTPVGVLVDRVSQVVRLLPSAIEARPQGVGGAEPGTIAGIGRERDRLFIILDPGALLGPGVGREQPA